MILAEANTLLKGAGSSRICLMATLYIQWGCLSGESLQILYALKVITCVWMKKRRYRYYPAAGNFSYSRNSAE